MKSVIESLEFDLVCSKDYKKYDFKLERSKVFVTEHIQSLNRDENELAIFLRNLITNILGLNFLLTKLIFNRKKRIVIVNNFPLSLILLPSVALRVIGIKFYWFDYNITTYDKKIGLISSLLCYLLYNKTFVVSEAVSKKYLFKKKIKIVYNGIDCKKYYFNIQARESLRKSLDVAQDTIVIGFFGTISHAKGVEYVLGSFNHLRTTYKHIHLLIIGKFNNLTEMKFYTNKILDFNSSCITLLDWTNNIVDYYSAIDILINATSEEFSEPLGMTILEAMCCKRIVIASATGGTVEILSEGKNGFLFKPDDLCSLTEKLDYVIRGYEGMKSIGEAARATVLERFSLDESILQIRQSITI